jgi:acyl-CoA synthetase (AMP-forming)/AMP-acid ligase II
MASPAPSNHFMFTIKEALRKHADKPAYRPYIDGQTWGNVTMQEVEQHLAAAGIHWQKILEPATFKQGDVIGCWYVEMHVWPPVHLSWIIWSYRLTGKKYTDIVNVLSLCSLGFVPQLFSPNFTTGQISAMLSSSKASAFVVDPDLSSLSASYDFTVPVFATLAQADLDVQVDQAKLASGESELRMGELPAVLPTDPAFIGHTSGSTGGLPKTIPQAHRWIDHIHAKWSVFERPEYGSQTVLNTFGNLAHVGSFCGKERFELS